LAVLAAVPFRNTFLFNPILKIMESSRFGIVETASHQMAGMAGCFRFIETQKMKIYEKGI